MKNILIVFFLLMSVSYSYAQVGNAEQRARQELKKRGLDEEEVRKRLAEKGVDLDNIDVNNAAQVLKAEKSLQEVMKEIEADKAKKGDGTTQNPSTTIDNLDDESKKVIAKQSEEVSEAIDEGATLEEAVSETLIDNQEKKTNTAKFYGQEIFRSQSLKLYRQSKDVKPPDSYVLGVNDVIGVSIWGNSEESLLFEINEEGYIKPNGIPRIYLKGITYGGAKKLLKARLGNYYNFGPNQFEVTLNFSRTINVSVVGNVFNFGSFNIPAINTAFNALVAAGGPNDIGSVRKIQLIRAGDPIRTIDMYKYLQNPEIEKDYFLQENDYIFVPVAEKLVTVSGAVRKPFKYELLTNENLKDLFIYAQGLKPNAIQSNIQIFRYENDEEKIIDVNWREMSSKNRDFTLLPGDRVVVNQIQKRYNNYVTIGGAVEVEGRYAYENGDRIAEVIEKAKLVEGALLELSYIRRLNDDRKTISYIPLNIQKALDAPLSEDNILLKPEDRITVFRRSTFIDQSNFTVNGAVRNETTMTYDYDKTIRISDAIFLAGGLTEVATDFAYIRRKDKDNPKQINYIRVNLAEVNNDINSKSNLLLEPNDVLTVYSELEFVESQFVSISGEIKRPGSFTYDEDLTIQDVLLLSGGLKYIAANNRIDVYRIDFEDNKKTKIVVAKVQVDEDLNIIGENIKLAPFDEIIVRRAPEYETQKRVSITGEVVYPGQYVILSDNETFTDLIARAGGLTNEAFVEGIKMRRAGGVGFIVSDFKDAFDKKGSINDIILKEGDNISIPKLNNLITITGFTRASELYTSDIASSNKLTVPFEEGKNAWYYVDKYAAGVSEKGKKSRITVTDLSGRVLETKRFLWIKDYPDVKRGSIINVGAKPVKIDKQGNTSEPIDWNGILADSIAQATTILTLLLLVQRVD